MHASGPCLLFHNVPLSVVPYFFSLTYITTFPLVKIISMAREKGLAFGVAIGELIRSSRIDGGEILLA